MKKEEQVVIRIEVRRGKEIVFQSVVPDDVASTFVLPRHEKLAPGRELTGLVVTPYVMVDPTMTALDAAKREANKRAEKLFSAEGLISDAKEMKS